MTTSLFEQLNKKKAEEKPKLEIVGKEKKKKSDPELPTYLPTHQPTYPPISVSVEQIPEHPVSPERDFSKVPNSVRRAIEKGVFPNSSLAVYLYLLSLTRTAIKPVRVAKVPKSQLLVGSNLRAEKALLKNLAYLNSIGLIRTIVCNGDRGGNEYEVFTPDEIKDKLPTHPPTYLPTDAPTYVGSPDTQVPTDLKQVGRWVDKSMESEVYSQPKTSFKDNKNTDDDGARINDVYSVMVNRFDAAAKKFTGKTPSTQESEKWGSLADLLILELEAAATRAESISSVPAFLTEVLRRQFFAARQQQKSISKSPKAKPDTIGKSDSENFEIKPLDAQGRELALEELKEFAGETFLDDFKKWYTDEDWQWLTEQLKNH